MVFCRGAGGRSEIVTFDKIEEGGNGGSLREMRINRTVVGDNRTIVMAGWRVELCKNCGDVDVVDVLYCCQCIVLYLG